MPAALRSALPQGAGAGIDIDNKAAALPDDPELIDWRDAALDLDDFVSALFHHVPSRIAGDPVIVLEQPPNCPVATTE